MAQVNAFRDVDLQADDVALLTKVGADLPILADLCRADLLLYCSALGRHSRAVTVAQARPHSSSPLYAKDRIDKRVKEEEDPELARAFAHRPSRKTILTASVRGATVARQMFPATNLKGELIAVLVKDAYWLAYERHRRRTRAFQEALVDFTAMVLDGELEGGQALSPFGEHDGIVFVDSDGRIQYMSGIALELYRHLGYRDSLVGRRVGEIDTPDGQMYRRAVNERHCFESQDEQDDLTWTRKAIPVLRRERGPFAELRRTSRRRHRWPQSSCGALILVHDATETLRAQRELESKLELVQEVHHRVKNSLQVVASIMRMHARRATHEETRAALEESVNRVLSVAVVHEFLSQNAQGAISLREVAYRILNQVEQGLIHPGQQIDLTVSGPDIWLPAERATQCALVINELVHNAVEHGLADRNRGKISVDILDQGDSVYILVADDGHGLPDGFSLETDAHLGLQIVQNMVRRDLKGEFMLAAAAVGTQARVVFDKTSVVGGR